MASLSCQVSRSQGQGQGCLPMAITEYDNSEEGHATRLAPGSGLPGLKAILFSLLPLI